MVNQALPPQINQPEDCVLVNMSNYQVISMTISEVKYFFH